MVVAKRTPSSSLLNNQSDLHSHPHVAIWKVLFVLKQAKDSRLLVAIRGQCYLVFRAAES